MTDIFRASTCYHQTSSGNAIDLAQPPCKACELEKTYEDLATVHNALPKPGNEKDFALKQASRKDCIQAKLAHVRELDKQQQQQQQQQRQIETVSLGVSTVRVTPLASNRVRFDESQQHRPESQYREPAKFQRQAKSYEPGRWSNATMTGYLNTSDPKSEEDGDTENQANTVGQPDLRTLSDEQLDKLFKEVEARIKREEAAGKEGS